MGAGASAGSTASLEKIRDGAKTRVQWMRLLGRAAMRIDGAFAKSDKDHLTWSEISGVELDEEALGDAEAASALEGGDPKLSLLQSARLTEALTGADMPHHMTYYHDRTDSLMTRTLIIGTLNLLSEDDNPWQFEPPVQQVEERVGKAAYEAARAAAGAEWERRTVGDALATLDEVAALPGADPTRADLAARARAFVAGVCGDDAALDATPLLPLFAKKLDLQLDNKWLPAAGRLNPIVYGLSPEYRLSALQAMAKHGRKAGGTLPLQMAQARKDARAFSALVVEATLAYEAKGRAGGFPSGVDDPERAVLSLLLWDIFCTGCYAAAADAFDVLARTSYLVSGRKNHAADHAVAPMPKAERFASLLTPLDNLANRHPDAAIVIGCQEMPMSRGQLPLPLNLSAARVKNAGDSVMRMLRERKERKSAEAGGEADGGDEAALGKLRRQSGTSWHLDNIGMPEDDESDCGFLHRNIEFEDVTARCRTTLAGCLDNAEAAILGDGAKLNKKIKATTLRKSAVGLFTTAHEHFAVINLHVKSFKEHGDVLARFITEAQAKLAFELAEGVSLHQLEAATHLSKQAASLAEYREIFTELTPIPVICLGDMNIDSKFHKGTSKDDMLASTLAAPLGELPQDGKVDMSILTKFCDELTAQQVQFMPPKETMTTIKRRTPFQGQPEKTGELTVGHKDFVILPRPPPNESIGALEYQFKDVVLGGWAHNGDKGALKGDNGEHVKADSTNLALLQPSERWPGDHCAVFCYLDAAGNEGLKRIAEAEAEAGKVLESTDNVVALGR